jgi:hypothetical protein
MESGEMLLHRPTALSHWHTPNLSSPSPMVSAPMLDGLREMHVYMYLAIAHSQWQTIRLSSPVLMVLAFVLDVAVRRRRWRMRRDAINRLLATTLLRPYPFDRPKQHAASVFP